MDNRWLTIFGMLVIAYLCRVAGFWLASKLPEDNETLNAALKHLPMVSLVSLTAPSVIDAGWPGIAAAAVSWAVTWKTGNLMYAMIGGVAVFALLP